MARVRGTVKWFNTDRGFGFIAIGDGQKDVFVHAASVRKSGITGDLDEDDVVEFEVEHKQRGPQAVNIVRLTSG